MSLSTTLAVVASALSPLAAVAAEDSDTLSAHSTPSTEATTNPAATNGNARGRTRSGIVVP